MARSFARAVLCAALTVSHVAHATHAPTGVPAKNQAVLMMRVLLYDRNLAQRASDSIVRVVVVSKEADAASRASGEAMSTVLSELARRAVLGGRKIVVRHVSPDELAAVLALEVTAAVYFAPGTGTADGLASARRHHALSFSSESRDAAATAVGFVLRGDRVVITVNLATARAEGADLDSELLALADVR